MLTERRVTDTAGSPRSPRSASPTSPPAKHAPPNSPNWYASIGAPAEALHWIRDTVYREDHSRARAGSGPRVMASPRNLAIGALHLAGRHDIAVATHWIARSTHRPFLLLGPP